MVSSEDEAVKVKLATNFGMRAAPRSALRNAIKAACGARPPSAYAGAQTIRPLDAKLEDATWLAKAESEGSAVMLLDPKKNVAAVTAAGSLAWASPEQADACGGSSRVLLGRRPIEHLPPSFLNPRYAQAAANQYCFASAVDANEPSSLPKVAARFVGLREIMAGGATPAEAAMAGQARNLLLWHRTTQFCGSCGSPTAFAKAGWRRHCTSCGAQAFPRTDPVVIAAVLSPDGQRVLIGRQKTWPKGRFSCLAGFCDPGETLEEAVRREVREEAGVTVGDDIFYHSSQPWPNGPAGQLMLGFLAVAESTQLAVDTEEIESARWADLSEVAAALGGGASQAAGGGVGAGVGAGVGGADAEQGWGLMLPTQVAIAHSLLSAACEVHAELMK